MHEINSSLVRRRDSDVAALNCRSFETRSRPALSPLPRGFTFYLDNPFPRIETPSLPKLSRHYPRGFTFYLSHPVRSIPGFLGS